MDSPGDIKPIVTVGTNSLSSVMLTTCDQSPLGRLMEQYNRLASETRASTSDSEKIEKREIKTASDYVVTGTAVAAYPSSTAYHASYAWPPAASPWWPEPTPWPPIPYPSTDPTYPSYLSPPFQGLLAGVPNQTTNNTPNTTNSNTLMRLGNAATGNVLPHGGGGKITTTRSNCECPNCQETERIGKTFITRSLFTAYFYREKRTVANKVQIGK